MDGVAMTQQVDQLPVPQTPPSRHRTKPCPFCAETIRYAAIKCRFCGEFLPGAKGGPDAEGQSGQSQDAEDQDSTDVLWAGRPSIFAMTGTVLKIACFTAACWAVYAYPVTRLVTYIPNAHVKVSQLAPVEAWIDLAALALASAAV